jgi:FkbM family methyltransferase
MSFYSLVKNKGLKYSISVALNVVGCNMFIARERILNNTSDKNTFSQHAEDLFIDRMLKHKSEGFYIDIGANHPVTLNNTKRFYDRGWAGVNVEPNNRLWQAFNEQRPRDLNLNVGVGNEKGGMEFYIFERDTLSTFSKSEADMLSASGEKLKEKLNIEVIALSDIFEKIQRNYVDFISIDTEGWDEKVLRSNDWTKNRAGLICVEKNKSEGLKKFFSEIGYKYLGTNGLNDFYLDYQNK